MLRVLIEKEGFRVGADHNNLKLNDSRGPLILGYIADEVITYSEQFLKQRYGEDSLFSLDKDVLFYWPSKKVVGKLDEYDAERILTVLRYSSVLFKNRLTPSPQ